MELTEVEFWDNYWRSCELPSTVNHDFSFERCLAQEIRASLPDVSGEVFEVGCAPGKWLAFMAETFGMRASGIDYSEAGMRSTLKNFEILDLPSNTILAGDFFTTAPPRQFDVVMSFGFIEHFDDPESVVQRHLDWLKPGGHLIIGVPNFNGIYKPIQAVLDQEILDKHNLDIMNLDYFSKLGKRLDLEPVTIKYLGSFEPSLPIARPGFGNPLQAATKVGIKLAAKLRQAKFFDRFNNKYVSSYILAIYRKSPVS